MAEIQHVIVLMLENRSFDSMLGWLHPNRPGFAGLNGTQSNSCLNTSYKVSTTPPANADANTVPTPDPGETFTDITEQLYGSATGRGTAPPPMSGFAKNYFGQATGTAHYDPAAVMHSYTDAEIPVLWRLAQDFAVSDQWFAAAPCQTWPNRFFTHCGTCHGIVNNSDFTSGLHVPFTAPSIFRVLENAGHSWRVYFHDVPQSLLLRDIEDLAPLRYRFFNQFLADAAQGALPHYSFIEPHYFGEFFSAQPPNDQHPPHDVRYGEQLTADVYHAVRQSPCWQNTLLIITYDEHGGCYDHIAPPAAVPPDGLGPPGYNFNSYGVRVPAVVISPWIAPGAVLQPMTDQKQPHGGTAYPFDHTSIMKTISELFALPAAQLTPRAAAAPSLLPYLTLPAPTNNGPYFLQTPRLTPTRPEINAMAAELPNDLHKALGEGMEILHSGIATIGHDIGEAAETVAQIGARAVAQVRAFLGAL